MKLPTARITAFLSKPDPDVRVILVYGPDAGLVRERANNLAKWAVPDPNDPFCSVTLPSSAFAASPSRLHDEMAAVAFGGGRRLVRVQNTEENMALALAALLADMPRGDNLLLIEAGDLEKKSKLRKLCEEEPAVAVAVPCYVEDTAARQRTITEILTSENIRAPREVVATLAEILPPDRLAMRSELEKFALYVGASQSRLRGASTASGPQSSRDHEITATINDVHASVQDAGAAELDDLVYAIGAGETRRVAQLIDRLYAEQTSPVALLRAAQRHFVRLQWARAEMDKGVAATDAVKRLQPPVFWKYESAMTSQLRRWSRGKTEHALRRLFDAEAAVKRTGTPDTALCAQTLLGLAA